MESYALVSKTLGHASHSAHCKHLSASTNPVMFTHQTPEPRYLLDPQGVSPHLHDQRAVTADTGHGSTHPLPKQQRAASSPATEE